MQTSVTTPCVRKCCLDGQDNCLGCGRTLAEILAWQGMTENERKACLDVIQARIAEAAKSPELGD